MDSLKNIVEILSKETKIQLCVVHLLDITNCLDINKFVGSLLVSLSAMIHIELPFINVLTKADLLSNEMLEDLDFIEEGLDYNKIATKCENSNIPEKLKKLLLKICEKVEEYGLVYYEILNIKEIVSMNNLQNVIERGNGFEFNQK